VPEANDIMAALRGEQTSFRVVSFPDRPETRAAAALLLVNEFRENWPKAWPTVAKAAAEVDEALTPAKVVFAALAPDDRLIGWIGGQPMYDGNVWELHPLVVDSAWQGRGVGRALVSRLEEELSRRGALTLWVGTDDEANLTSLGGVDLYPDVLGSLMRLENRGAHPIGFYLKLGFAIAGVVPDANGFGKPDILLAKRVRAA
jgi:aminoglycoside 6'-N-acetyltransferase I